MKTIAAVRFVIVFVCVILLTGALSVVVMAAPPIAAALTGYNANPPGTPAKLIFIHHSVGENWLNDNAQLGIALRDNNYFVSDTNYGWGPADVDRGSGTIGDNTDIQDWYTWFTGPHRDTYLAALYAESSQHASYSRLASDPGGENTIIMFKSCFENSGLDGTPNDPPAVSADLNSPLDMAHAKRIYLDLLPYFAAHQNKLFVVITAPPWSAGDTDAAHAANARAFNNWLVNTWRSGYAYHNVAVFDYYNILTTNGGDAETNDLGATTGNHHRYRNGVIEHTTTQGGNTAAYAIDGNSHPSLAGNLKATGEFLPLLNIAWHCWHGDGSCSGVPTYRASDESGNWSAATTWRDNVLPQSNDAITITTGTTVTLDINARSQQLVIEPGAVLDIAANATLTVTDQLINHGTIRQTRSVNHNRADFLAMQDGVGGVVYQGAVVSSTNNLGNVTVSIRDLTAGEYCTSTGAVSPAQARRCFEITAQNNLAATVRLWAPVDQLNGVSVPRVFRYVAPTWVELSLGVASGVVDNYAYAEATTPSFSKFVIAQAGAGPTAVGLREIQARSDQRSGGWLVAALGLTLISSVAAFKFIRR